MIISVDDHVVEPAHLWRDRGCPAKHRADAPTSSATASAA